MFRIYINIHICSDWSILAIHTISIDLRIDSTAHINDFLIYSRRSHLSWSSLISWVVVINMVVVWSSPGMKFIPNILWRNMEVAPWKKLFKKLGLGWPGMKVSYLGIRGARINAWDITGINVRIMMIYVYLVFFYICYSKFK